MPPAFLNSNLPSGTLACDDTYGEYLKFRTLNMLLRAVIGASYIAPQIRFDDSFTPSSAWDVSALSQDNTGDVIPPVTADHTAPPVEVKLPPSSPNDIKKHTVRSNRIDAAARKRRLKSAKFRCFVPGCGGSFTSNHNITCKCIVKPARTT
jgi:hypothetical protein